MKAYLVSTRHGAYLTDSPNDNDVVIVEFSKMKLHRKSISVLLEKLGRAHVGKPYAQVYGVFEGRLIAGRGKERPRFEMYSEASD